MARLLSPSSSFCLSLYPPSLMQRFLKAPRVFCVTTPLLPSLNPTPSPPPIHPSSKQWRVKSFVVLQQGGPLRQPWVLNYEGRQCSEELFVVPEIQKAEPWAPAKTRFWQSTIQIQGPQTRARFGFVSTMFKVLYKADIISNKWSSWDERCFKDTFHKIKGTLYDN